MENTLHVQEPLRKRVAKRIGRKSLIDKMPDINTKTSKNLSEVKGGYIYKRDNGRYNACACVPFAGCVFRKCGLFYSLTDANMFIRDVMSLPPMTEDVLEAYLLMDRTEMAHRLNLTALL